MTRPTRVDERATSKPINIPTVLAVGGSDAFLARCWEAVAGMAVMVRDCAPEEATTLAAVRRPLVIVAPRGAGAAETEELEALARDVRATFLSVGADMDGGALSAALAGAIRAAQQRREGRTPSGRYAILPGEGVAGPGLASCSEPPPVSAVQPSTPTLEEVEEELRAALR